MLLGGTMRVEDKIASCLDGGIQKRSRVVKSGLDPITPC